MLKDFYKRLTTPESVSENVIFFFGILTILAITAVDIYVGESIRLHMLHLFPLAAISLHCKIRKNALRATILSLGLQFITLQSYGLPITIQIIDVSIAVAASVLTVAIARTARQNHLELVIQATHDVLTGLLNRRNIVSALDVEIELQKRHGGCFTLAMIDLDKFKQLNDLQGHKAGDEALQLFTKVLRHNTRASDALARIGGDEFVVLLRSTNEVDGPRICQKICSEVEHHMLQANFAVTASIGCKTFNEPPLNSAAAIYEADEVMYRAKTRGKGRVFSC